jgi:hypothetical protein
MANRENIALSPTEPGCPPDADLVFGTYSFRLLYGIVTMRLDRRPPGVDQCHRESDC